MRFLFGLRARTIIGGAALIGVFGALYAQNLAALYVAVVGYVVVLALHSIEFKINRLLDERGISVPDHKIERDLVH